MKFYSFAKIRIWGNREKKIEREFRMQNTEYRIFDYP